MVKAKVKMMRLFSGVVEPKALMGLAQMKYGITNDPRPQSGSRVPPFIQFDLADISQKWFRVHHASFKSRPLVRMELINPIPCGLTNCASCASIANKEGEGSHD